MSQLAEIPHGIPLDRADGPFNPPPSLAGIRQQHPITPMLYYPDGHEGWLVTGHALARQVLADPRFSNAPREPFRSAIDFPGLAKLKEPPTRPGSFLRMDPPDHTRLRSMLTGMFTVKRMKSLEPRVRDIVVSQLDEMANRDRPVDLVQSFALPVPSLVICELLGVPYADRAEFQWNSGELLRLDLDFEARMAASRRVMEYLDRLAKSKRDKPTDDLLSDLATRDGDLTDDELAGVATLLLIAGHETTANMLALGTFALLEHPDQWRALADEPDLMPGAVEELMRWLSIIHIGPARTAKEDLELGGARIKAGDPVTISTSAANRDPEKFENPDTLDVHRHATGHVAFGHGIHQCLGQQLARIEMRIGYHELIRRFPSLRLAVPPEKVKLRTNMAIYGVHELPVTWE